MTTAIQEAPSISPVVLAEVKAFQLTIQKKGAEYLIKRGAAIQTLKEGVDFGPPWPGSKQDTLLLPGAEKFNAMMDVYPDPKLIDKTFDIEKGFFYFSYRVELKVKGSELIEAVGEASCNSWEDKYRYRTAALKCPVCQNETIIKGKEEWGGGWVCYKKKGGCGAKWTNGHKDIESQPRGQIQHPNPANEIYTLQAMAQKRARIAATRSHGCLSGMFAMPDDPEKGPKGYEPPADSAEEEPIAVTVEPPPAPAAEKSKPTGPRDKMVAEFKADVVKICNDVANGKNPDAITAECFGRPVKFSALDKEEILDIAKAMGTAKDMLR